MLLISYINFIRLYHSRNHARFNENRSVYGTKNIVICYFRDITSFTFVIAGHILTTTKVLLPQVILDHSVYPDYVL